MSGTVYEHGPFGQRPLPNAPMVVTDDLHELNPQSTDEHGRYTVSLLSSEAALHVQAAGFRQPCVASTLLNEHTTVDVHVVPETLLATSGIPSSVPVREPQITGRVFERTNGVERPISGVRVSGVFDVGLSWSAADTLTDTSGRYVLCGIKDGTLLYIGVPGYTGPSQPMRVDLAASRTYDLELTPKP